MEEKASAPHMVGQGNNAQASTWSSNLQRYLAENEDPVSARLGLQGKMQSGNGGKEKKASNPDLASMGAQFWGERGNK
ncbi:hypothetical protein EPUS_04790 [Endocarpon pusillum Z07020]|uniref:Uncharacterized protein n=1 Tax=Endocarpon pusillum (strain Z07020 / HMAS-L-300199) TaxID=1263415 RepID=U1G5X2_ENDPU|nr:uncharacterized protein EPUS_04790 [Endocarpon pusillum Z07020]ERF72737.1 hypothetical protein EPUS_04790 [Endocarpon pusillum Z07020]